jgi:hypothetical protein
MREFSTNAYAIRDRKEGAAQTHQENATPTDFSKLKPVSPVGKGAAVVGEVGKAAGRVVEGLSGDDPGQYVRDTLAGKKVRLPDAREVQGAAASLSLMRCRPSATDLASLAASGSSGGFSVAHSQNAAMSAARSVEIRESARPDSMMGIRAVAARRRFSAGVEGAEWASTCAHSTEERARARKKR